MTSKNSDVPRRLLPRLFVAIDDVLIMWGAHPNLHHVDGTHRGKPWRINRKLLVEIRRFETTFPKALIVLWSPDYTQTEVRGWRDRVGLFSAVPLVQKPQMFRTLVRDGDVVVDSRGEHRTHWPWSKFASEATVLEGAL